MELFDNLILGFSVALTPMNLLLALVGCLVVAMACAQSPTPAASSAKPPPCEAPEHRQFDFWLGRWDVTVSGQAAGTNEITLEEDGCVLHEHWVGSKGGTGQSFNWYDRAAGRCRRSGRPRSAQSPVSR